MQEIGVRELKQSLSRTLRAVSRGQRVRVTLRGQPLADIVPAGASTSDQRLRELGAAGRLTPPTLIRSSSAPHLVKSSRSASSLVLSERDADR